MSQYLIQSDGAPTSIPLFDGSWVYIQPDRAHGSVACGLSSSSSDGGFSNQLLRTARVVFNCANHYGSWTSSLRPEVARKPPGTTVSWTPISGKYALGNHGGSPLSYYETTLAPGAYTICCPSQWSTGVFFTNP